MTRHTKTRQRHEKEPSRKKQKGSSSRAQRERERKPTPPPTIEILYLSCPMHLAHFEGVQKKPFLTHRYIHCEVLKQVRLTEDVC